MRIITNFKSLDIELEPELSQTEVIQLVFDALQSGFQDQINNEAYFSESFSESSFILGSVSPDEIRKIAHTWNQDIKDQFIGAFKDLGYSAAEPEKLPMDTPKTYTMQKAARELDNNWWAYADHGVYLENEMGYPYYQVMLSESAQKDMLDNPGNYIVADLYVKD